MTAAARLVSRESRSSTTPSGDSYSVSLDDKAATYARLLRDLPPGLNDWAVHPAHGTEQWRSIDSSGWQVRQSDHAFLTSQQAREILDREGITVIDYRPLQQAWNTGGGR